MNLYKLNIKGYRKHQNTTLYFDDCSFLIGMNNIGKSSIFKAIEILLSDVKKLDSNDFFGVIDEDGNNIEITDDIVITAEFRNCPSDIEQWRGFKGRIFKYEKSDESDSGLSFFFRKIFKRGENVKVQIKQNKRSENPDFVECRTINELYEKGFPKYVLDEIFSGLSTTITLSAAQKKILKDTEDYYIYDTDNEEWFENPGGIPGVVLSKLPNFLLIPAQDKIDEISGANGTLIKTLNNLFEDVRNNSENFKKAQEYLTLLEEELDPNNKDKEFGKMMGELNLVLSDVFPNTSLKAIANLSNPDKSIKPSFDISMLSNYNTPVAYQGTGVVRAAVFAMLRYRDMRSNTEKNNSLIICFEEPEIYLHPNAANQLRDTIYSLAANPNNQIICTTHSPFMIDLTKTTKQILNHLKVKNETFDNDSIKFEYDKVLSLPFNITEAYKTLSSTEKDYVKMILKMDEYVSKVFFAKNILIVEGDTEDLVFKETLKRLPDSSRNNIYQEWNIIKARGKAAIIPLVKYFNAMGIKPYVIHDKDTGVAGAEKFNQPIADIVESQKLFVIENCIEDILGYSAPSYDKPYKAYEFITKNWGEDWDSVSENWRALFESIFNIELTVKV